MLKMKMYVKILVLHSAEALECVLKYTSLEDSALERIFPLSPDTFSSKKIVRSSICAKINVRTYLTSLFVYVIVL